MGMFEIVINEITPLHQRVRARLFTLHSQCKEPWKEKPRNIFQYLLVPKQTSLSFTAFLHFRKTDKWKYCEGWHLEGYGDYLVAVKCGLGAWQMCPIVWTGTDGRELTAVWKGRLCIWRRGSQDSGRNRETFSKFGDEDVLFCHLSTIGCGSANISYFIESLN